MAATIGHGHGSSAVPGMSTTGLAGAAAALPTIAASGSPPFPGGAPSPLGRERTSLTSIGAIPPRKESSYASSTATKVSIATLPLETLEHIIEDFKAPLPPHSHKNHAVAAARGGGGGGPTVRISAVATTGGGGGGGRTATRSWNPAAAASGGGVAAATAAAAGARRSLGSLSGASFTFAAKATPPLWAGAGSAPAGALMQPPVLPGLPPGAPLALSSRAAAVLQVPESAAHLQRFIALDAAQLEHHYIIASPAGTPVNNIQEVFDSAASIDGLPPGKEAVVVLTTAPDGVPVPRVVSLDQPGPNSLRRTGATLLYGGPPVLFLDAAPADSAALRSSGSSMSLLAAQHSMTDASGGDAGGGGDVDAGGGVVPFASRAVASGPTPMLPLSPQRSLAATVSPRSGGCGGGLPARRSDTGVSRSSQGPLGHGRLPSATGPTQTNPPSPPPQFPGNHHISAVNVLPMLDGNGGGGGAAATRRSAPPRRGSASALVVRRGASNDAAVPGLPVLVRMNSPDHPRSGLDIGADSQSGSSGGGGGDVLAAVGSSMTASGGASGGAGASGGVSPARRRSGGAPAAAAEGYCDVSPTRSRLHARIVTLQGERSAQQLMLATPQSPQQPQNQQQYQQQQQQYHQQQHQGGLQSPQAQPPQHSQPGQQQQLQPNPVQMRGGGGGAGVGNVGGGRAGAGTGGGAGTRPLVSSLTGMDLVRAAMKQVETGERTLADPLGRISSSDNSRRTSRSSIVAGSGGAGCGPQSGSAAAVAAAMTPEEVAAAAVVPRVEAEEAREAAERRQARLVKSLTMLLTTGRGGRPSRPSTAASHLSRRSSIAVLRLDDEDDDDDEEDDGRTDGIGRTEEAEEPKHAAVAAAAGRRARAPPPQPLRLSSDGSAATLPTPLSSREHSKLSLQASPAAAAAPSPKAAAAVATPTATAAAAPSPKQPQSQPQHPQHPPPAGSAATVASTRSRRRSSGPAVAVAGGSSSSSGSGSSEPDTLEEAAAMAADGGLDPKALLEFAQQLDMANEEFRLVEAARERARRLEALLTQAQLAAANPTATARRRLTGDGSGAGGDRAASPDRLPLELFLLAKRREGIKPPNVTQVISSLEAPLDRPMEVDLEGLLEAIGTALAADELDALGQPVRFDETFRIRTERYLSQLCRLNPAAFEEVSAAQAEADYRSSVERAKLRLRQLHGEVAGEPLTSAGKPRNQYDKSLVMLQAHRPFFLPPVMAREAVERAPVPPMTVGRGSSRPPWDVYASIFRERKRGDARDVFDTDAVLAAQFHMDWSRVVSKMLFMKLVAREDLGVRGKSGRLALEQELGQVRNALAGSFGLIRSAFVYYSIATPEEIYNAALSAAVAAATATGASAEAAAAEIAANCTAAAAVARRGGGVVALGATGAVPRAIAVAAASAAADAAGVSPPSVAESERALSAAAATAAANAAAIAGGSGAAAALASGHGILEMDEQRWLAFCTSAGITGRATGVRVSDLCTLFWTVNREEERNMTLESLENNDYALMRFEFVEALVRAAFGRYITGGALRDASDATQRLMGELRSSLPAIARVDPNEFRRTRLYTADMEVAVVHNLELLTASFKLYKARDRAKYLSIEHWMSFLETNNLLMAPHMGGITPTEARLVFAWSQMVVVDELKLRRRAVSLQLWDFVEAVARLSERICLPPSEEMDKWMLYNLNIGRHTPLPPGHTRVWTYCNALAAGRGGGPGLDLRGSGRELLVAPGRPLASKFRLLMEYLAGSLAVAWGGANSHETAQSMLRTAGMLCGGVELA